MEESYQLALNVKEKQNRQFSQKNRGARRAHCLPHGVVLIVEEVNHPKELKKHKTLDKITWTNHEEEDFRGVEATMVEEGELIGVLGVV